jgi:chromosome segregation ATPase
MAETPAGAQAATSDALDRYTSATQDFATADMSRQHDATSDALDRLADALATLVPDEQDLEQSLNELHAAADRIRQSEWTADTHAGDVHDAFAKAADVLERSRNSIRATADDALDSALAQVREAADAIDSSQPLLEQRDAVQRFLTRSASALRQLAEPPAAG